MNTPIQTNNKVTKQKFIDTEKIKIIDYLEYQGTEYTLSLDKESKECFLIKGQCAATQIDCDDQSIMLITSDTNKKTLIFVVNKYSKKKGHKISLITENLDKRFSYILDTNFTIIEVEKYNSAHHGSKIELLMQTKEKHYFSIRAGLSGFPCFTRIFDSKFTNIENGKLILFYSAILNQDAKGRMRFLEGGTNYHYIQNLDRSNLIGAPLAIDRYNGLNHLLFSKNSNLFYTSIDDEGHFQAIKQISKINIQTIKSIRVKMEKNQKILIYITTKKGKKEKFTIYNINNENFTIEKDSDRYPKEIEVKQDAQQERPIKEIFPKMARCLSKPFDQSIARKDNQNLSIVTTPNNRYSYTRPYVSGAVVAVAPSFFLIACVSGVIILTLLGIGILIDYCHTKSVAKNTEQNSKKQHKQMSEIEGIDQHHHNKKSI